MSKLSRRKFVLTVLAGGGASAVLVLSRPWRGRADIALDLGKVLGSVPGAEAVGRAYLRTVPSEGDIQLLGELVFSEITWSSLILGDPSRLVAEQVRRDFEVDRVVRLRRWVLSRTEARLCAIVALASAPTSP